MRDFNSEGYIQGRPYQGIMEQSATQKYPIGMILDVFGRRYRYCRAAANITPARRGCPALIYDTWKASTATTSPQFGSDGTTVTGLEGDNFVIATFGADYDTLRPVDCLQDGLLTLFDAAGLIIDEHRIIGNDLSYTTTLANDTCKIYIDPPLARDHTAVPADGLPSPYNYCGDGGSVGTMTSVIVVNPIIVTSGYYFWGQTRGPCWVTPNAGWQTAATRECEWHTDGTIKAAAGVALQRAGYLLAENTDSDDCHIMLMLE
jgi:uncharacterized membrane protein